MNVIEKSLKSRKWFWSLVSAGVMFALTHWLKMDTESAASIVGWIFAAVGLEGLTDAARAFRSGNTGAPVETK